MSSYAPIPLACSTWDEEEMNAMQDVIHSGIFTMGENVKKFEEDFATYHKSKYCVMVNSGSSANFLMIAALFFTKGPNRLKRGDEVIVPSVSWSTSYSPLYFHGLKLRFGLNNYFDDIKIESIGNIAQKNKYINSAALLKNELFNNENFGNYQNGDGFQTPISLEFVENRFWKYFTRGFTFDLFARLCSIRALRLASFFIALSPRVDL